MAFALWTKTDNQTLIDHNAGIDEFIVAYGLPTRQGALTVQRRIVELYGDENTWIEEI